MAKCIQLEIKKMPALSMTGKVLTVSFEEASQANPLPAFWGKCFVENAFAPLEAQAEHIYDPSYIGYMTTEGAPEGHFLYLCGIMMHSGAPVPEGYQALALAPCEVAIGWIQGVEADIYPNETALTEQAMREKGYRRDPAARWEMEVYNCPHFTQADENGEQILDMVIPCVEVG